MKTKIRINGMTCEHCVKRVENALRSVTGVSSVDVNLEQKSAEVKHNGKVTVSELIITVIEAGYEATNQ